MAGQRRALRGHGRGVCAVLPCLVLAACEPATLHPVRERVVGPEGRVSAHLEVRRASEAIELDGRLDEWLDADAVQVSADAAAQTGGVADPPDGVGGRWLMVYEESNAAAAYWADSDDGISWTRRGAAVSPGSSTDWDGDVAASPGLLVDGDRLLVVYGGLPVDGNRMDIGLASGPSLDALDKSPRNPIFHASASGWSVHVAQPRLVREGSWTYLFYEGADRFYSCDVNNRFGWGVARSRDLDVWERFEGNPLEREDSGGCGSDKPNPFVRDDGQVFVYHMAEDAAHLVREALVLR